MSLRDNKKERTRTALRAAAYRLFREKGFDDTTVDQIAAEAGVSRTTFFRYYPTKEAVVFGRARDFGDALRKLIVERPRHENPLQAFEGALVGLARETVDEQMVEEARSLEALLEANPALRRRHGEHVQEQIGLVAEALADRDGRSVDVEHRVAAGVGLVVSQAVRERWHAGGLEADAAALLEETFALVRELAGARRPG